jgi:hypothetical protein
MAQVTVNLPNLKDWRTTMFGIGTALGYALYAYFTSGHITWQGAVACALWTIFCYLVPDAKSNTNMQGQIEALLKAVSAPQPSAAPPAAPPAEQAAAAPVPDQAAPGSITTGHV